MCDGGNGVGRGRNGGGTLLPSPWLLGLLWLVLLLLLLLLLSVVSVVVVVSCQCCCCCCWLLLWDACVCVVDVDGCVALLGNIYEYCI